MSDLLTFAALLPQSIGPYLALMVIGFAIGALGHLVASKTLVAVGIILIFLATVAFPIAINLTNETPSEVRDLATRSR